MGEWTFLWRMEMAQRVLCHIAIVFFIPSMLMGTVSPLAVKMALESKQNNGRTIGRMYALGAAGSILGTFLAGFWLIGTIGTVNTLWVTAGILLVIALIYQPKAVWMYMYAVTVVFLAAAGTINLKQAQYIGSAMSLRQPREPDMLYETESQYGYVAVHQLSKQPDERQFVQDNVKSHSQIIMGKIRDLRFFYVRVYGAVTRRAAAGQRKTLHAVDRRRRICFPAIYPGLMARQQRGRGGNRPGGNQDGNTGVRTAARYAYPDD